MADSDFDRQRLLKNLNQQRNRLKAKGASPAELTDYFGYDYDLPFGKLQDDSLKKIADNYYNNPKVTVQKGYILPIRYIKAHNYWYEKEDTTPLVKGFKKSLQSGFMTKDNTLSDTKMRKQQLFNQAKSLYIKGLEDIWDTITDDSKSKKFGKIINSVGRMSEKRFWAFINSGHGTIDFNVIYDSDAQGFSYTDDLDYAETLSNQITKIYENFRSD